MQGKKSPESPQNWGRTVGMDFENKLENKKIKKVEGNYLKNPPNDIALQSACPTHLKKKSGRGKTEKSDT